MFQLTGGVMYISAMHFWYCVHLHIKPLKIIFSLSPVVVPIRFWTAVILLWILLWFEESAWCLLSRVVMRSDHSAFVWECNKSVCVLVWSNQIRTTWTEIEQTVLIDLLLKLTHSFKALVRQFPCWREEYNVAGKEGRKWDREILRYHSKFFLVGCLHCGSRENFVCVCRGRENFVKASAEQGHIAF